MFPNLKAKANIKTINNNLSDNLNKVTERYDNYENDHDYYKDNNININNNQINNNEYNINNANQMEINDIIKYLNDENKELIYYVNSFIVEEKIKFEKLNSELDNSKVNTYY